jgi:copper homeostasis protein
MNKTKEGTPVLEVCAGDIESVVAAKKGGAVRVELCSALGEGGITPSLGMIKAAVAVGGIDINVLIRPRGGDFLYTEDEVALMCDDIRQCAAAGVHGVVIGALRSDGSVDFEACRRMVDAAGNLEVTFHRAFDMCRKPACAFEEIIRLGCHRLLTSGQAASAWEGRSLIADLSQRSEGRISVMPGGGVSPENAAEIIRATGVWEIHASARKSVASDMRFRIDGVAMGNPGDDEYTRKTTSSKIVRSIVNSISKIDI